ncbi:hypothetical protein M9Y10_012619 [Tritrichomonas musculus]|uniref:Uncharacterized protein n=1 Tax=Tritrichomonas musculus TaxID=1915356 RepID=A0ABR2ICY1_9EUKA
MNDFQIQNSPEELRFGVLTKYIFEGKNSTDYDQKVEETLSNAEKKIQKLNTKIVQLEELESNIKKYKATLKNIENDANRFLDENQDFFVLINQLITGNESDKEEIKKEEEEEEEDSY